MALKKALANIIITVVEKTMAFSISAVCFLGAYGNLVLTGKYLLGSAFLAGGLVFGFAGWLEGKYFESAPGWPRILSKFWIVNFQRA